MRTKAARASGREAEQERVRRLDEIPAATEFFFREEPVYDERAVRKWLSRPETPAHATARHSVTTAAHPGPSNESPVHGRNQLERCRAMHLKQGVNACPAGSRSRHTSPQMVNHAGSFISL